MPTQRSCLPIGPLQRGKDLQRDEMRRLGFTADYREGVAAFLEKRAAKFEGR